MGQVKKWILASLILSLLAVVALLLQFMALADIADDGAKAILEWRIVGLCMMITAAFVVIGFITLMKTLALMQQRIRDNS